MVACVLQDPVPKVGKFGSLSARPAQTVLMDLTDDLQVRRTPQAVSVDSGARRKGVNVMQDPVPKVGKFGTLYARPGQRVLIDLTGDMQVRPTPLEMRLPSLNPCKRITMTLSLAFDTNHPSLGSPANCSIVWCIWPSCTAYKAAV